MAASDVDICSQALELLGARRIGSFEENDAAGTCGRLYPDRTNTLLGAYPWRFAQRQAKLDRLSDAPSQEWRYRHQLPPGMVHPGVMAVKASGGIGAPVVKDFEIFKNEIHSNFLELWVEYTVRPPETEWPPHFYQLAIYAMAAHLAMPITEDTTKAAFWNEVAFGTPAEEGQGGYFRTARRTDAQQQPTQVLEDFAFVSARFGDTRFG